jgi:beta-glucuronidase
VVEVPVYWMIEWDNPATLANATNQLKEMIRRDRNKASVVLWSAAKRRQIRRRGPGSSKA